MRYYPLNVTPELLQVSGIKVNLMPMGALEIITDGFPALQQIAGDPRAVADLIEIGGLIVGDLLGGESDATLKLYSCDQGLYRDQEPFTTLALNVDSATAQGVELVTNGDFAADTDWIKGASWSIAAGFASHDETKGATRILQAITIALNTTYLLKTAVPMPVRVFLGGQFIGMVTSTSERILHRHVSPAGSLDLAFEGLRDEGGILDDVSVKVQRPFYFTKVVEGKDAGGGMAVGVLPAADFTGSYLTLWMRRYQIIT